jgi:hypothetical protein
MYCLVACVNATLQKKKFYLLGPDKKRVRQHLKNKFMSQANNAQAA